jgi:hypothetical protein
MVWRLNAHVKALLQEMPRSRSPERFERYTTILSLITARALGREPPQERAHHHRVKLSLLVFSPVKPLSRNFHARA